MANHGRRLARLEATIRKRYRPALPVWDFGALTPMEQYELYLLLERLGDRTDPAAVRAVLGADDAARLDALWLKVTPA